MEISFKGKKAIVTGAGSGIGKDITKKLCALGAVTYGLSIVQAELDALSVECPEINTVQVDVSDWKSTQEAINKIGAVDLLVNCAGICRHGAFLEVTEEDYDDVFNVNVKGTLIVSQAVARLMVEEKVHGSIVNISSIAGVRSLSSIIYCASKGAVEQLTRCMAVELGPHQIRVNALQPTAVLSTGIGREALALMPEAIIEVYKQRIPLGQFAEVEQVTNATLYLLSDKADMINGAFLPVDGGMLCT